MRRQVRGVLIAGLLLTGAASTLLVLFQLNQTHGKGKIVPAETGHVGHREYLQIVGTALAQEDQATNSNEMTIPEGTEFKLQLHTTINSKTSKPGDRVLTSLLDPVSVEDIDVLQKGVRIDGHLGEVKQAGRRGKGGYLTVVFDTLELPNGEKVAILGSLTEVFSSAGGGDPNVGPEGELKGRGPSLKKRAAIVGVPMAAGAGGVAAGATAAGVAAAAGGVVAAILIPRGRQAALSAGSLIGMRLDRDLTLNLPPTAKQ